MARQICRRQALLVLIVIIGVFFLRVTVSVGGVLFLVLVMFMANRPLLFRPPCSCSLQAPWTVLLVTAMNRGPWTGEMPRLQGECTNSVIISVILTVDYRAKHTSACGCRMRPTSGPGVEFACLVVLLPSVTQLTSLCGPLTPLTILL